MKKERVIASFFVLIAIIFLHSAFATIKAGNISNNIQSVYGPEGEMKGWINVSIQNEDSDLVLRDSKKNSINLLEILQLNEEKNNLAFSCDTKNCVTNYKEKESFKEKTFNLGIGEEKTFGFLLEGTGVAINSVEFIFDSDASSSCLNQFEIFFGNSKEALRNQKYTNNPCSSSRSYGCFNSSQNSVTFRLDSEKFYCQKIKVLPTPALSVGAWLKKSGGNENVTFFLIESMSGQQIPGKWCKILSSEISGEGSEKSCTIAQEISSTKEQYLCVRKDRGEGNIMIKGYSDKDKCGYYSNDPYGFSSAYQMFLEGVEYDSPSEINVSNTIYPDLTREFNNYLSEVYLNGNCSEGCIIPIKISSKTNQTITLKNLKVGYSKTGGEVEPKEYFSEIERISPKISTNGFVNIYLDDAGFIAPKEVKKHNISFYIEDEKLFQKEIEIQGIPIIYSLIPPVTFSAYPTEFFVSANSSNGTISSYTWKFSNSDKNVTTSVGKITHTFNSTGVYSLEVTVRDSSNRVAQKIFNITVQRPEEAIARIYNKSSSDLLKVKQDLNRYPAFVKKQLSEKLEIDRVTERLEYYFKQNASAGGDIEKKNAVLTGLLNLTIPEGIFTTHSANSTFIPKSEKINLEILAEISQAQFNSSRSEEYREQISLWQLQKLDINVAYTGISALYENEQKYLLGYYFVTVSKKEGELEPYVILKKMEGFKQDSLADFNLIEKGEYYYFSLRDRKKDFHFVATEEVNFFDLPLFASLNLRSIELPETIPLPGGEGPFYGKIKWGWLMFAIFLVLLIALGVYLFLQSWYKYKYESYLFKGRNNMYNLITFIEAQKKLGISDSEIIKKLKISGWSNEQVNYVIRKYLGKRTGMVEIPIKNPFDPLSENSKNKSIPEKKPFGNFTLGSRKNSGNMSKGRDKKNKK